MASYYASVGADSIPVGTGTSCGQPDKRGVHEFTEPFLSEYSLENGQDLLVKLLADKSKESVSLLLISGMTDASNLIEANPELASRKVAEVVIMGGIEVHDDGSAKLDGEGYITPDTAANNKFDMTAAQNLYRNLQELGIRTVTLNPRRRLRRTGTVGSLQSNGQLRSSGRRASSRCAEKSAGTPLVSSQPPP